MGSVAAKKRKKQSKLKDFVTWFEIPAINFQQSVEFYSHIYGMRMEEISTNGYTMAFFPVDTGIGGAIVSGPGSIPSDTGPLLYLNGGSDLSDILGRVLEAGGRIVMPKTCISKEAGYFALFMDTEGNKLALHSKN